MLAGPRGSRRSARLRRAFEAVGPRRRIGGKHCADADDENEREYRDARNLHGASLGRGTVNDSI